MENNILHTPVAFIIFNRPDLTEIVFTAIRKARPAKLFVIADGPRSEAEASLCQQARDVINKVDWKCDVRTNYAEVNLGCKGRLSSGIDWVFKHVDRAIILEDDCLPHPSFFTYCDVLLDRYKNDERVMHIAGVNFQNGIHRAEGSYYFSKYPHIWGWATWKRAWMHYDVTVADWPEFKLSEEYKGWCFNEEEQKFWNDNIETVCNGKTDTWDFQWVFAVMKKSGHCVMPNNNMIANIGFRSDATHTKDFNSQLAMRPIDEYKFPDKESFVALNDEADKYTFRNVFNSSNESPINDYKTGNLFPSFIRIKNRLRSIFYE